MATWPAVPRGRYLTREEVLSIVAHGFIGCYGYVHGTDMESLCWRGETRGVPPVIPRLALLLRASHFHITHYFYHYDLMTLLKNFCTRQLVGPLKSASNRAPHLQRPVLQEPVATAYYFY